MNDQKPWEQENIAGKRNVLDAIMAALQWLAFAVWAGLRLLIGALR